MRKDLLINDVSLNSMGIFISSDTYLNSPLIDYTEFQVPGRDGNIILDNKRLNNVMRKFDCYIPETQDINTALGSLKKLIYNVRGYVKIVSDYDPEVCQYGYFAQELNIEPFVNKTASFSLYFSCLPQRIFIQNDSHISSNNIGNSGEMDGYVSNDDEVLNTILANAKISYPYSPVGWILSTDSSAALTPGNTYTLNITSSDTEKYIVLFRSNDSSLAEKNKYKIIAEVENYSMANVSYTPTDAGAICFAMPILGSNMNIDVTYGSDQSQIHRDFCTVSSTHFTNTDAFGCEPLFLFTKIVRPDYASNSSPVDLFTLNKNWYWINFDKMVDDYTANYVINNLAITDGDLSYIYVLADIVNSKAYLLDSASFTANILLDISDYFYANEQDPLGDSVDVRFGSFPESNAPFLDAGISGRLYFKMGWWKL